MSLIKKLRSAASQLEEDAADCWGIRRKLNLKAAAKLLEDAAHEIEALETQYDRPGVHPRYRSYFDRIGVW